MSRIAWLLLAALLASNVAWYLVHTGSGAGTVTPRGEPEEPVQPAHTKKEPGLEVRPGDAKSKSPFAPPAKNGTGGGKATKATSRKPDLDARAAERKAAIQAAKWAAAYNQTQDARKRAAALEAIRTALGSDDPAQVRAALWAVARMRGPEADRAALRPEIADLSGSADATIALAAFSVLPHVGSRAGDGVLERLVAFTETAPPELAPSIPPILAQHARGDFKGAAAAPLVRLLGSGDRRVVKAVMFALNGADVSEPLERALLGAARNGPERASVVQGLGRLKTKSEAVLRELVRGLSDYAPAIRRYSFTAIEMLRDAGERARAADLIAEGMPSMKYEDVLVSVVTFLGRTGRSEHASVIEDVAANTVHSQALRNAADQAARQLRSR